MAQLILNNNDYASDFRTKINDNFTELYNNNVPTNHSSSLDMYGLGTGSLYGHVRVSAGNGLNINTGQISLSQATTIAYGATRLAANASSTSATDVITGAILNTVTGGLSGQGKTLPMILKGTSDPSNSLGNNDDVYIKYA